MLGVQKESKRSILSRALREQQAAVKPQHDHMIQHHFQSMSDVLHESFDVDIEVPVPQQNELNALSMTSAVGAGLKRPLELNDDGNPMLKKRIRLQKPRMRPAHAEEPAWDGFGSSDVDQYDDPLSSGSDSTGTQTDSDSDHGAESCGSTITDDDEARQNISTSNDEEYRKARKERSSAFKAWATQQVNEALAFMPAALSSPAIDDNNRPLPLSVKPRAPEHDPLPAELEVLSKDTFRKIFTVKVDRPPSMQEARHGLPVVAEEQKIMEAIHNNPTVVIWGATGSGKTTQVPQFLYEAGYGNQDGPTPGMIGVTQPRRVAAVSMAKRVGDELGSASGKVSYQIRFESNVSDKTAIKFMTDGILIREIAKDFSLSKYSAIIIDEAHERTTNTDILIGMVSRIIDLRGSMSQKDPSIKPLKLIIMSATLRISDFTKNQNLFRNGPPPLLEAEGRQYSVSIHFARRTQRDYMEEAFQKVSRGHKKLPPGGMLVFLTGQNEISALAKRLKQAFPHREGVQSSGPRVLVAAGEAPLEAEDLDIGGNGQGYGQGSDDESEILEGFDDTDDGEFDIGDTMAASSSVYVLPLYSQLPTKEQLRVFEPPPDNSRLIVLATNVAETSLTIPGIRYVFDCGRAKERRYDRVTGVQSFEVGWVSKASAWQRAGRAGRTGPGHCYRLYSSAVYERDFQEHAEPEILRMPVEGVVLQLKSMDLQNVVNFPFPTPPDRESLAKAEKLLMYLGAVSRNGKITSVGQDLSIYPLSPRFSKMLLIGHQHGCMPYTIAMIAALIVQDIFIPENQLDLSTSSHDSEEVYTNADRLEDNAREKRKRDFNRAHHLFSKRDKTSDALKLLSALCAYAYVPDRDADKDSFCSQMFLRPKALKEASHLRQQLTEIARLNRPGLIPAYEPRLPEPSSIQLNALKQILAAGFIDHIAIRADLAATPPPELLAARKPKRACDVPYLTLFPSHHRPSHAKAQTHNSLAEEEQEQIEDKAVYPHPSSLLALLPPPTLPQYLIYSHLQRSTLSHSSVTGSKPKPPKIRLHALTSITGAQISALAKGIPLLEYGKPLGKIVPLEGTDGGMPRRECWLVPSLVPGIGGGGGGGLGWPLPAQKVVQRRDGKGNWEVESVVV